MKSKSNITGNIQDFLNSFLKRKSIGNEYSLKLFAFYIASNPDFKYNITYLTDQISSFTKSSAELKLRFNHFEKIIAWVRKQTPKEKKGYLIFDNVFQFEVNIDEEDRLTFNNLNSYRFDKINSENYTVKFILGDKNDPQKIETYKINRMKDFDNESKIEIKELWASFIK